MATTWREGYASLRLRDITGQLTPARVGIIDTDKGPVVGFEIGFEGDPCKPVALDLEGITELTRALRQFSSELTRLGGWQTR